MCELRTSNALFNQIEALKMQTAKMTKIVSIAYAV